MTVLSVNKINIGSIVATAEEPKGERREVGDTAQSTNGALRLTRQALKRNLVLRTVPLTIATAYAWECLLTGEGEVWSFDSSLYGSKGTGPSANVGCTAPASSPKYGAGRLSVPATTGSISYPFASSYGSTADWTVLVWRSTNGGSSWTHHVIRSDGSKWVNGVTSVAATTWLSVSSGTATIANTTGSAVEYDDLVVLPFAVPDAWPADVYAAGAAFPPLPYIDITGDLVPEQAARRVLGSVSESIVKTAAGVRVKLSVDLKAR